MKSRSVSSIIQKKHSSRFGRIIVLTGARQTGKTTLVRKAFNNYPYISVEDPVTIDQYKTLTAAQWKTAYPNAILDEIQKEPKLIESIKSVYDQFNETRYILSGSSQIMLLKNIRESLAGRCQIVELYPLTIPELITDDWGDEIKFSWFQRLMTGGDTDELPFLLDKDHVKKIQLFRYYLKYGGYPAISDPHISEQDRHDWLNNYVRTYLERDIRDLAQLRNLEPFTKTQRLMALNTGQVINHSRISVQAGVSSKTVQRFLQYMTISYQTLVLQPWSRNLNKRLIKSPKIHFLDIGILRTILQKRGDLSGHEFESAIVSEIYKQTQYAGLDIQIYHLRTTDGREVDLLIETEEGYTAIEIKQAETVRSADGKHLKNLESILDKPVLNKFILSNDMNIKDLGSGILAMPAVKFLT